MYLPGPAVGVDIVSSNHSARLRGEGGLPTAVSWGGKLILSFFFFFFCKRLIQSRNHLPVKSDHIVENRFCAYRRQQREPTQGTSSCLCLPVYSHLVYLYLMLCYATKKKFFFCFFFPSLLDKSSPQAEQNWQAKKLKVPNFNWLKKKTKQKTVQSILHTKYKKSLLHGYMQYT